jgi:hypothetical protein
MKGKIVLLVVPLLLAASCRPLLAHRPEHCTRQFLYTEYSTGRGATLETHPVYGCAATAQPVNPGPPTGSRS